MRIESVRKNNRRHLFEIVADHREFIFPYEACEVVPSKDDPVMDLFLDPEVGCEGFTFILKSGAEWTCLMDWILYYNRDPDFMRDLALYQLTIEAQHHLDDSGISKREVIRRLGTSPAQLYRLLDPSNNSKSVDQMLRLLSVLQRDVEFVVHDRPAPYSTAANRRDQSRSV